MSFWRSFTERFFHPREPTPVEKLRAHIDALLAERQTEPEKKRALSLVHPRGDLRVVVEAGLSRLEVHANESGQVFTRICGDAFVTRSLRLTNERIAILNELDFQRSSGAGDFDSPPVSIQGDASLALAEQIERLLQQVLGVRAGEFYSVALERARVPDNAALLDSMKELAKSKELEARRIVYQQIVNGWFYLAVDAPLEQLAPICVVPWSEPFGGRPVWAAFTDDQAFDRVYGGHPKILVSGIRLVQAALDAGLGALKLNPKSRVGGELYANELDSLALYLAKLGLVAVPNDARAITSTR